MTHSHNLLIGISGAAAVLALPAYLAEIFIRFPRLKIIMTHSATQFIPKETFSLFSPVYSSEFPLGEGINHVELARWADVFMVLPATAHLLAQAAHGLAADLLSATILAYEKRVIFVPNMNRAMWLKKATQRNVALLKEDGHQVISPVEKASFEFASRSMEPNHVIPSVESILSILLLESEVGIC